jgi:beta-aspartyl-peptidase (threonine type)
VKQISLRPNYSRLVLSLLLLTLLAIVPWRLWQQAHPADDQERAKIHTILDDQVAAWNRGDLREFMRGYWQDEKLTFYSGADKTFGWQATYDRYTRKYQGEGQQMGQLEFREIEIDIVGPTAALVRGRWELTFAEKPRVHGLFTLLVRKQPQGWCIVHDHTSG